MVVSLFPLFNEGAVWRSTKENTKRKGGRGEVPLRRPYENFRYSSSLAAAPPSPSLLSYPFPPSLSPSLPLLAPSPLLALPTKCLGPWTPRLPGKITPDQHAPAKNSSSRRHFFLACEGHVL